MSWNSGISASFLSDACAVSSWSQQPKCAMRTDKWLLVVKIRHFAKTHRNTTMLRLAMPALPTQASGDVATISKAHPGFGRFRNNIWYVYVVGTYMFVFAKRCDFMDFYSKNAFLNIPVPTCFQRYPYQLLNLRPPSMSRFAGPGSQYSCPSRSPKLSRPAHWKLVVVPIRTRTDPNPRIANRPICGRVVSLVIVFVHCLCFCC